MTDPKKGPDGKGQIRFMGDGDIVEILEENTQPGKVSESYRRYLERKYGRKNPPTDGPSAPPKES